MQSMTNNQELKQLMREYGLTHKTVSIALGESIYKVNRYCVSPDTDQYTELSDDNLNVIKKTCYNINYAKG